MLSHSLQRGSLIFDYMSVHETARGPAVFRLREHVARFLRSAELVGLPLAQGAAQIEAAILETVRANPGATAVKICAYLPSIEVDVVPLDAHVAVAIAAYDPAARRHRAARRRKPAQAAMLRLWIEKELRNRRDDIVPPQAKVAAQLHLADAREVARAAARLRRDPARGRATATWPRGRPTNVFLVDRARRAARRPPSDTVLLGVTRSSILEIAAHDGLPVAEERRSGPRTLFAAAEVFLTGTTAGVWPVGSIDDRAIGSGAPGPLSLRLRERFQAVTRGEDPDFLALAHARRGLLGRCASSPASSPRATSCTSATTSARCASSSRCRSSTRCCSSSPTTTR